MAVLRCFTAMILSVIVAMGLLVAVEFFSSIVHPMPADSQGTMEEMYRHVERYPNWVLALVVPAWAFIALISTWIAGRLGNRICATVIGLLLILGVSANIVSLPYPIWFKVVILLAVIAAIVAGERLASNKRSRHIFVQK